MTEPETRTAQTVHGEIEYEVVQCDNCEQWCRKGDSMRFYISNGKLKPDHGTIVSKGWACPICRDDGPIGFPGDGGGSGNDTGDVRWFGPTDAFAVLLSIPPGVTGVLLGWGHPATWGVIFTMLILVVVVTYFHDGST